MINHKTKKKGTVMKKTYIEPQTKAIEIKTESVLTMSQLSVGENMSSGSADSRQGGSSWDDDE